MEAILALDKKIKGEQNRLAILCNLQRFGWLTCPMIAALVWPNSSQAQAMARRTLQALVERKLVLKRRLNEDADGFTLSATGARYLQKEHGIAATSGASLPLKNVVHRACSNWYVIRCLAKGQQAWTEHEIQTGKAPVHIVAGKVPDALVETEYGFIWVEVENAWKNRTERARVLEFCISHLPASGSDLNMHEISPDKFLFRIAVVGTSPDALRAIARSAKEFYQAGQLTESQAADIELEYLPLMPNLTAGASVTGSLWYDALLPSNI